VIRPNDVPWQEIERAKEFIRKPLSEGFKAWSTLRDRDNVTMTIHELGHLMAWYAAVRMSPTAPVTKELEDGKLALPETTPEFYCVDREAGVLCRCTIQCSGCARTQEARRKNGTRAFPEGEYRG
jgi:hypothetical protein